MKSIRKCLRLTPRNTSQHTAVFCAYGVAVGKKFVADPDVWKIVGGKLYLNLDRGIQSKWNKDIPGYIKEANSNWSEIKDKAPSEL